MNDKTGSMQVCFCGGIPRVDTWSGFSFVECPACDARTPLMDRDEDAQDVWNAMQEAATRADSKSSDNQHYVNLPGKPVADDGGMQATAIIVIGPMKSGKTLNRDAIARVYGCQRIYDAGIDDYAIMRATGRILVLANEHPRDPSDRRKKMPGHVVSIAQAKDACGDSWIQPLPHVPSNV